MSRNSWALLAAVAAGSWSGAAAAPAAALPPVGPQERAVEARVWLDRGVEPVVSRGDRVRVYYRVSEDAFVAIFHIDTNGTVRLVHPRSPDEDHYVRGGRDYRLLLPRSQYWIVDDYPGMGYFFVVASPYPMDFSAFRYSYYDGGWDLTRVGRQVYSDPYVAMDDYVAHLIPDWEYVTYALDFTAYHVGQTHAYPRFLCYDCHAFRPYNAWNPYHYTCRSFRVVVYNDPYYYPAYRYRGTRVVYTRPPQPRQPRFVFKERTSGEPGTPEVRTRPAADPAVTGEPPLRRSAEPAAGPGRDGSTGSAAPRRSVQPDDRDRAGTGRGGAVTPDAPRRGIDAARGEPAGRPTRVLPGRVRGTDPPVVGPRTGDPAGQATPLVPRPEDRGRPVLERRPPPETRPSDPPATDGRRRSPVRTRTPPASAREPVSRPSTGPERGSGATPPPAARPPSSGSGTRPPVARPPSAASRNTPPSATRQRPAGGGGGTRSPGARPQQSSGPASRPPAVSRPPSAGSRGAGPRAPAARTPSSSPGSPPAARPSTTRRPPATGSSGAATPAVRRRPPSTALLPGGHGTTRAGATAMGPRVVGGAPQAPLSGEAARG